MSIADRLQDAKILLDNGRQEGALLSVLVAVAGSSRRRFPKGTKSLKTRNDMGDREAFETFLTQEMQKIGRCSVLFQGECQTAESVFYKWLRCSLAHEGELPDQIDFRPGESNRVAELARDAGPPERLIVTHAVILLIASLVAAAPENRDVPESVRRALHPC